MNKQSFRLTQKTIEFVKSHSKCKEEICQVLGIQQNGIYYHLDKNVIDGTLTKLSVLDVIARYMDKDEIYELTERV